MSLFSFKNLKSFSALRQLKKLIEKKSFLEQKCYLIGCITPITSIIICAFTFNNSHLFPIGFLASLLFIILFFGAYPPLLRYIYPLYSKTLKTIKTAETEILILFESVDEQYQLIDELKILAQINHNIYPIIDEFKIAFVKKDQKQLKKAFSLLFFNHSYLFEEKNDSKHPEQYHIDAFDLKKQKHIVLEQEHNQEMNGSDKEYSFKNHI